MRVSILSSFFIGFIMAFTSCGGSDSPQPPEPKPIEPVKKQIRINAYTSTSRVSDNSFDSGDRVGIFVVNYSDSKPGTLSLTGNHADNVPFYFNGSWNSDSPLYWKDESTHADFYLYYPYTPSLSSVSAIPFEVKENQSNEENYKASELLAGKTLNVAPSENSVNISARHLLSRVEIILEAGNGFKVEDLTPDKVAVKINGVKTALTLDLISAETTPSGIAKSITPRYENRSYRALVPPQTVEETNLISVSAGDKDYNLRRGFVFQSGTVHKFTVQISKTSNGVNVNISPWTNDGTDNGGVAE